MGIGSALKANMFKIGYVSGSCFTDNAFLTFKTDDTKAVSFSGGNVVTLTITDTNGEFSFTHSDVKYACICCAGNIFIDGNNAAPGVKYRVILNDGKQFIITADIKGSRTVERVLF